MKRRLLSAAGIVLLGSVAGFAVVALEQATKPKPELPTLLPEGALLSIEARDFASLLHDWNTSEVKRVWLSGDNHAAFITSRLSAGFRRHKMSSPQPQVFQPTMLCSNRLRERKAAWDSTTLAISNSCM